MNGEWATSGERRITQRARPWTFIHPFSKEDPPMTKPTATTEARPLERVLCKPPCAFLAGHQGRCVTRDGKYVRR